MSLNSGIRSNFVPVFNSEASPQPVVMATPDFATLPSADDFADRLDDFRNALKSALVKVVTELGDDADASDFDLRFLPLTLSDSGLELTSLILNDDESDPITLSFSDENDVELDELSTDDLVNLYRIIRETASENAENDE